MLLEVEAAVKPLDLPLRTPLELGKVVHFSVIPVSAGAGDEALCSHLVYEGGYEFWHEWGILRGFLSPTAYSGLQDPRDMKRLVGKVRYTEAECLAKFKDVMRGLGHTNLAVLDAPPKLLEGPIPCDGKVLPRYIFTWPDPTGRMPKWLSVATAEVNAEKLAVEKFTLIWRGFHREPWPVTFGQTNPPPRPKLPPKPVRTELEVLGVSQEEAVEKVRRFFLDKLGLPERPLFLDTPPVMYYRADPEAKKGARRYYFAWERPETEEQERRRRDRRIPPEISVTGEVDAVTGAIKGLGLVHDSLDRPDPKIEVPMGNAPATKPESP